MAVRLRDADIRGICTCISSGTKHYYIKDNIQAGHFLPSRIYPATRWSFDNVHSQSAYANGSLQGDQYRYGLILNRKYGYDICGDLYLQCQQPFKETIPYLETVKQRAMEIILYNAHTKNLWEWTSQFTKTELKEMGL